MKYRWTVIFSLLVVSFVGQAAIGDDRGFLGFRFDFEGHFREPLTVLDVTAIYPDGPAARAGMRVGDRVRALNGVEFRFESEEQARSAFDWVVIGEPVEVTVQRGTKVHVLELVPTALPGAVADHERRAREELVFRRDVERLRDVLREQPESNRLVVRRLGEGGLDVRLNSESISRRILTLKPFQGAVASAIEALPAGESLSLALTLTREGALRATIEP